MHCLYILIMQLSTSSAIPTRNPLLQLDLIHCTLDHIAHDFWDSDDEARQTLVTLAQTCHALSEPSLNHLWRKLRSLQPLIRSFTLTWNEDRKNACLSWSSASASTHLVDRYHCPQLNGLWFVNTCIMSGNSGFTILTGNPTGFWRPSVQKLILFFQI